MSSSSWLMSNAQPQASNLPSRTDFVGRWLEKNTGPLILKPVALVSPPKSFPKIGQKIKPKVLSLYNLRLTRTKITQLERLPIIPSSISESPYEYLYPNAPCIVYLPTFTINLSQMWVPIMANIPGSSKGCWMDDKRWPYTIPWIQTEPHGRCWYIYIHIYYTWSIWDTKNAIPKTALELLEFPTQEILEFPPPSERNR